MGRCARALAVTAMIVAVAVPAAAIPPPGAPKCPVFPSNNVWHADISHLPVNSRSSAWLASMNAGSTHLHPDFGPSGTSMPYGIPYNVVSPEHKKISITFDYADESDPGPYPFGSDISIEGGTGASGDRHAIMIDSGTCKLYELYDAHYSSSGSTAGSGAIWSLTSNALRPAGWTSADAAGLPIFAGLVRLDEVKTGNVDHAIRVTAQQTDRSYIWPARHQAGAANNHNLPPMGARFRLKSSYNISQFRTDTQTVLRAMKKYGLIVADNGSNWYFQGSAENGWNTSMLDQLKTVPASAFEAIDESSLMVSSSSGAIKTTSSPTHPTTVAKQTATPTPRVSATPSPRTTPVAKASPAPSPSVTPSPSGTTRVVAAQPDPKQKTSIPLWLLLLAGAAAAIVIFLVLRARQKSNLPSK